MSTSPAQWHQDPTGRHQMRYWDGAQWTEHVSDNGATGVDPIGNTVPAQTLMATDSATTAHDPGVAAAQKIQDQIGGTTWRGAGISGAQAGGGTLFTEPVLVVNQKAKVLEVTNQYSVFNSAGQQVAAVNQVGQSTMKKVLRVVSSLDQFMTHHLEITDAAGQVTMRLTRPRKVFKSTVVVADGAGNEIGRIVQENMIGKIHFGLEANGASLGSIKAENWRAWNFRIEDHTGAEVARITKTFEGVLKTMFTTADNYVLQIHQPLAQPLHALVVASALSVDTALKQDARGFG